MMRFCVLSVVFLVAGSLSAQSPAGNNSRVLEVSPELSVQTLTPNDQWEYELSSGEKYFTSLVVKISGTDTFENSSLVADGSIYPLELDEHADLDRELQSLPVIFDFPRQSTRLLLPNVSESFSVYYINAGQLASSARTAGELKPLITTPGSCEEPESVDQSEWRKGLSAPSYSRSYTETEHLIVHHSATSNSLTDYYNVVRNIYIYHTQVNGWSDIGYNYLVAPDGTIFKGRDPGDGEQDLVLGAHFCGKNSTTMGVCMMGDYSSTEPKEEAISALEALLTWKASKDMLDVLGSSPHPLNGDLNTIAGHRQGCATQCPGDKVFERLETIRQDVFANLQACSDPLVVSTVTFYPNPSEGDVLIELPEETELEAVDLVTMSGQKQSIGLINEGLNGYRAVTSFLQPGVYVMMFKLKNELPQYKKIILR
ncbi:N-acetylmuramoyl-L-alanine amidase [uncultured Imperialibacter sp.]|uniref:N-acetylmuramoyl-L-alanine amidase n=1 Tax=uncultured Imperialibacter sp. TaxID=1672639 RepID=UPI0030D7A398|tara:strand:- start:67705 stop:68985 length:1281 start_codon:yes stop_codon:yes gene_type:complete